MALPNQLIVSGAGSPEVNGTYTKGANHNDRDAWYSDNNTAIFIKRFGGSSTAPSAWVIAAFVSGSYFGGEYYRTDNIPFNETSSPDGLTFNVSNGTGSPTVTPIAPAPTVTAAAAAAPSTVTFPSSPTLNQSFTAGSRTWVFNGTAWKLQPKTTDAITEGSTNKYYTDARVAAAPAVTALESRAGTIESAATSLEGRVTTAEGSITTLTSGLATEKGRVDAILDASQADKDSFAEIVQLINSVDTENDTAFGTYVTNNNAAVAALEGRVDTAESDIDSLESRATAVEGRATTLEGDVATLQTDVTAVEGRLDTAESDIAAIIDNVIGQNDQGPNTILGRLNTAESDIDALEGRATTLESDVDAAEGRLDTAESDIDALETGKQIKNVLSASAPSHVEGLVWIDTTDMSQYVSYAGAWVELDKA